MPAFQLLVLVKKYCFTLLSQLIMKKILFAVVFFALFYGCENFGYYCYLFYNYSNREIVVFGDFVPTDSVPEQISTYVYEFNDSRYEHELHDISFNDSKFKRVKSGDTLSIFVIDKEIYQNNDWEVIRNSNLISARFLITKDSDVKIYYYGDE